MGQDDWGFSGISAFGEHLGGTTGIRSCSIDGIVKQNVDAAPYCVANEFICGRLGLLVGLPVPPGAIVPLDDGGLAYVALRFGPRGESPPPAFEDLLARDYPELALRIVAFDSWIANNDRHAKNLSYSPGTIPLRVFDHERALLGAAGIKRLEELRNQAILNCCLVDFIPDLSHLGKISDEIQWIAKHRLSIVCDEALEAKAISKDEKDRIVEFLQARAGSITSLVSRLPIPGQLPLRS